MGRYCDFPKELLEEIMLWLPPESLKRFKCVSKSWYVLINSLMNNSAFVAKHLGNMKIKRESSPFIHLQNLVITNQTVGQESSVQQTYYLLTLVNAGLVDDLNFSYSDCIPCEFLARNLDDEDFKLVSHCNGIICLYDYCEVNSILLNPAIREFKIVPTACLGELSWVVGFGYDSRVNDYKVVVLTSLDDDHCVLENAKVYSLSTNCWKDIEFNVDICIMLTYDYQVVYCKGVCYFYFWESILSFDVADEVFREMPVPRFPREMLGRNWDLLSEWTKIADWNESLVLFFYTGMDPMVINMWVMNDCSNGVQGSYSWTKHLTIGPLVGISRPLAFWDDDELFLETEDGEMIFYNLRIQKLNNHTVWVQPFSGDRFVTYAKSLVSVLRRDGL